MVLGLSYNTAQKCFTEQDFTSAKDLCMSCMTVDRSINTGKEYLHNSELNLSYKCFFTSWLHSVKNKTKDDKICRLHQNEIVSSEPTLSQNHEKCSQMNDFISK